MNEPTPLPTTDGLVRTEMGGGSLAEIPPDRYADHAATDAVRFMVVRWQDDKKGKWSKEHPMSLGKTGSIRLEKFIQPMGMYRTRQFEWTFSDSCSFCITWVNDDLEDLE